jgi:hypothetical protein
MWGDEQPAYLILVNNHPFVIRQNLYNFLSMMRAQGEYDTLFWIDQISINQRDVEERNEQVLLMSDIYTKAGEVYTWLGPAADDNDLAFVALRNFERWWEKIRNESPLPEYMRIINPKERLALLHLLTRPYWSRIWIIQEVFLAKKLTLLCGSQRYCFPQMREDVFENLFRALGPNMGEERDDDDDDKSESDEEKMDEEDEEEEEDQLLHDRLAGVFRLIRYRYEWLTDGTLLDLVEVLHPYHTYDSSVALDQVFGFQACLLPEQRIKKIDYRKSEEEVFRDMVENLVRMYVDRNDPRSADAPMFMMAVLRGRMGLNSMKTEDMRDMILKMGWPAEWK